MIQKFRDEIINDFNTGTWTTESDGFRQMSVTAAW